MKLASYKKEIAICILLIAITLCAYSPVRNHSFLTYDDYAYVIENEHVSSGLSWANIVWAFTSFYEANWHPLAWISHMIDVSLYGLNPTGHHITSLLLHLANTILLFFVFTRMTKRTWECAFVAALFAIHPLHVESVAWIAERKDVLCAFFWLLTLWAYARYAEQPASGRFVLVCVFFCASLMSKPMAVTLPAMLLLLDYWPLGRVPLPNDKKRTGANFPGLIIEKMPLFALSALSCATTYLAQSAELTVRPLIEYPILIRLGNSIASYSSYLIKTAYPLNLCAYYPLARTGRPFLEVLCSLVVLVCLTWLFVRKSNKRYTAFGWLWYAITLVPVIGIVQVGQQSMADRYTYIPLIGIFIIIVWGLSDIVQAQAKAMTKPLLAAGVAVSCLLSAATYTQVRYWRNNVTLFGHAVEIVPDSFFAHNNLAIGYATAGDMANSEKEFKTALQCQPDYFAAHNNLAAILYAQGRYSEAWSEIEICLKNDYEPDNRLKRQIWEKISSKEIPVTNKEKQ